MYAIYENIIMISWCSFIGLWNIDSDYLYAVGIIHSFLVYYFLGGLHLETFFFTLS